MGRVARRGLPAAGLLLTGGADVCLAGPPDVPVVAGLPRVPENGGLADEGPLRALADGPGLQPSAGPVHGRGPWAGVSASAQVPRPRAPLVADLPGALAAA